MARAASQWCWRGVKRGDAVAVVAPAGPAPAERLAAGLSVLEQRYEVLTRYRPTRTTTGEHPYLAATDADRAAELNHWIDDERVAAVFCARGGYGCARIIDRLDGARLEARRVPLIGFSDITMLHAWASCRGLSSIHGPVVTQLAELPSGDQQALFALLERGQLAPLTGLQPLVGGVAEGRLIGGNLTLLSHLCGTALMPPLDGAVLLIEEVGEAPYRVDRKLTHLALSGVFDKVAGVLVGDLVGCDDARASGLSVVKERLGGRGLPVLAGAPVGHGKRNLALPLGAPVRLDADAGTLALCD